jgi:hypothetical protein
VTRKKQRQVLQRSGYCKYLERQIPPNIANDEFPGVDDFHVGTISFIYGFVHFEIVFSSLFEINYSFFWVHVTIIWGA